jgi:hypothetical protein
MWYYIHYMTAQVIGADWQNWYSGREEHSLGIFSVPICPSPSLPPFPANRFNLLFLIFWVHALGRDVVLSFEPRAARMLLVNNDAIAYIASWVAGLSLTACRQGGQNGSLNSR